MNWKNLITRICFIVYFLLILISCSQDENHFPDFDPSLTLEQNTDQFVLNFVNNQSPGVAVFVRDGNEILLNKGYGASNIESNVLIDSNTSFYLASVSKQITAMSTMILAEQGIMTFNEPIKTYLPEVPESWKDITVHHLLTHRSGMPDYLNDLDLYAVGLTNSDVLDALLKLDELEFVPGSRYEYSNSGYLILAILTARVSGLPFHEFISQHIFDPLSMLHSGVYDESAPLITNRAIGYFPDGQLNDYQLLTMGDGGMFSSIHDLDKWEQSFYTEKLISFETIEKAFTSYQSDGYGYGWNIDEVNGHIRYYHGGGLNGYRSRISRFPSKEFSIIILSNGTFEWIGKLHDEIIHYFL